MRISAAQAGRNRQQVLDTASERFRERGFDGVGVSDRMKSAGFTPGGLPHPFAPKDALAAEALAQAWAQMAAERARARNLEQLLAGYLSRTSRDAPGSSCPAAALGGDVGRRSAEIKNVFAAGLEEMITSVERLLPPSDDGATRTRAMTVVNGMVGALMLSRAVPDDSPLADELLASGLRAALAAAAD